MIGPIRGSELGDVVGASVHVDFQVVLKTFDFHDFSFEGGVFFHVVTIDAVEFGVDGNFEIIDVMDDLFFDIFDLECYFLFLPFDRFLEG